MEATYLQHPPSRAAAAVAVLLLLTLFAPSAVANTVAFPSIWPLPQWFTNGTTEVAVDPSRLTLSVASPSSPLDAAVVALVTKAYDRIVLHNVVRQHDAAAVPVGLPAIWNVSVSIARGDPSEPLQLYVDESYNLTVNTSGGFVEAVTVYGAYHGLETLSQLISFDFMDQTYLIRHVPWAVTDYPRFPHRGLLIDTSRHWQPLEYIKLVVDSITYAKLNVIHWHIVDAQAFPFLSATYPKLGENGSWSSEERYTMADVAEIVAYAKERGIRVMVEFDTPGHTGSMCFGEPDVCPTPLCTSANINNWALDITKEYTYTVVRGVLGDLTSLFFENLIHLGGDEVDYTCWAVHPYITKWLAARNLTFTGGYEYYVKRVQQMAWSLGREVVGWEEIWNHFGTSLDKRTIIQQWLANSVTLPLNVTSHGYRLIWSDSAHWYLDHLDVTWEQMYSSEPCVGLPDANCQLILGGEGCMWGETVDASDGLQTIWPRLAAIAERLWSAADATPSPELAAPRLYNFRCLLNRRGVPAAPVNNSIAREAPIGPGSCYDQ